VIRRLSLENVDSSDFEESVVDVPQKFVNSSYGVCGSNELVGHGQVTSERCGTYRGRYGCLNVGSHELPLQLQGKKCVEQVYQHPVFYSCHRPRCPKCFRSWLVREARAIAFRLAEADKYGGKIEHVVASVPPERYGLSFVAMRALTLKVFVKIGQLGIGFLLLIGMFLVLLRVAISVVLV